MKSVYDIASTSVNLMAFSIGVGAFVVISSWKNEEGVSSLLHVIDENLPQVFTAYRSPDKFRQMAEIALTDPQIIISIRDLMETLTHAYGSPVSCARAVEGIRHAIAKGEKNRERQWIKMNEVLRLDKSYLDIIFKHAIPPRHGEHMPLEGSINNQIVVRSWTIMNRFFEYKLRECQPLPLSEFPILLG